jgi:hypothetical protein
MNTNKYDIAEISSLLETSVCFGWIMFEIEFLKILKFFILNIF